MWYNACNQDTLLDQLSRKMWQATKQSDERTDTKTHTVTQQDTFTLEALVDFPDDALVMEITAAHIDAMMRQLAECRVRRVSWGYYADGRGGFLTPAHDPQFANLARTYHGLGQNPLAVAVQAAHRHGLESVRIFQAL